MRVVYLYGPPGVGKLTVGTELAALTGYRLFHNHLTVNLAVSIFPRESPPWIRMIREMRRYVLAEATKEGVDLIYTGVYLGTEEQTRAIQTVLEPVRDGGCTVLFVQLQCDWDEHAKRVQNESRIQHQKLTDPSVVLARYNRNPTVPFTPHLHLNTTHLTAAQTAAQIAAHYDLPLIHAAVDS
jgi:hypothetical protein